MTQAKYTPEERRERRSAYHREYYRTHYAKDHTVRKYHRTRRAEHLARGREYYRTHAVERREYYRTHAVERRAKQCEYYRTHAVERRIYSCKYYKKHLAKIKTTGHQTTKELPDWMIKSRLSQNSTLTRKEWPQELVDLKRQLIKTRRLEHEVRC